MNDVTTRVLDELNTIPGTTARPGLSRIEESKPFIYEFIQRYFAEDFDEAAAMNNDELFTYLQTLDKRILDFGFDTQEKQVRFTTVEDSSVNEQTLLLTDNQTQPDFETIILERDGDVIPKLVAVSLPASLDLSSFTEGGGLPFHVFFHPTLGQNTASYYTAVNQPGRESLKDTIDGNYSPYGWDFLFFIILRNLSYQANTNINANNVINEWAGKGLLYQIANADKNVINIIPVLDPQKNGGDFERPDTHLQILKEVQQFLLNRQGDVNESLLPVGKCAVSAFSSGHLCSNNLLQASGNNSFSEFYGDVLQEVYMFDAPVQTNDNWVQLANAWAQKYGDEKVIRAYSQWTPTNVNLLLAKGQAIRNSKLVLNSDNPNRSFALLGQPFFKDIISNSDWQAMHQAIPSLMLNDALSRSQF
jgi:hypothetical protein